MRVAVGLKGVVVGEEAPREEVFVEEAFGFAGFGTGTGEDEADGVHEVLVLVLILILLIYLQIPPKLRLTLLPFPRHPHNPPLLNLLPVLAEDDSVIFADDVLDGRLPEDGAGEHVVFLVEVRVDKELFTGQVLSIVCFPGFRGILVADEGVPSVGEVV